MGVEPREQVPAHAAGQVQHRQHLMTSSSSTATTTTTTTTATAACVRGGGRRGGGGGGEGDQTGLDEVVKTPQVVDLRLDAVSLYIHIYQHYNEYTWCACVYMVCMCIHVLYIQTICGSTWTRVRCSL